MENGPLAPPGKPEGKRVSNPANFLTSKYYGARRSMLTGRLKTGERKKYAEEKTLYEKQERDKMMKEKEKYNKAAKQYKDCNCKELEETLRKSMTWKAYLSRQNVGTGSTTFSEQNKKVKKAEEEEIDARIALKKKEIAHAKKALEFTNIGVGGKREREELQSKIKEKEEQLEELQQKKPTRTWLGWLSGQSKMPPSSKVPESSGVPSKLETVASRTKNSLVNMTGASAPPAAQGATPAPQQGETSTEENPRMGGGFTRRSSLRKKYKRTRRH